MEPAASSDSRRPAHEQGEFPFSDNAGQTSASKAPEPHPNGSSAPPGPYSAGSAPAEPLEGKPESPVWMQRVWLIVYVAFCVELGMLLVVLPWTQVWNANALLANLPGVRQFLHNNFVRGAVTGLGLIDIWLGIWEAVRYRDRRKAQPPRSNS